MKNNQENNYIPPPELEPSEEEIAFFKQATPPFSKTKAEIWEQLSTQIATPENANNDFPKEPKIFSLRFVQLAKAAVIVFAIGLITFVTFANRSVEIASGAHGNHTLPDGSKVTLNAASHLEYNPILWYLNRSVNFEGEAFFEVEKGSKFTVTSTIGKTQVMGTSFNISTRAELYKVFCATGKVRVIANDSQEQTLLEPNMSVVLMKDNSFEVQNGVQTEDITSWISGKFNFSAEPLPSVLAEIERQYAIQIEINLENPGQILYSGNFTRLLPLDSTLNVISQTFGVTFVKLNDNSFKVSP